MHLNQLIKKLEQLLEYYEELNVTNSQVVKYLDYLAEKFSIMVNENKSLKETSNSKIQIQTKEITDKFDNLNSHRYKLIWNLKSQ